MLRHKKNTTNLLFCYLRKNYKNIYEEPVLNFQALILIKKLYQHKSIKLNKIRNFQLFSRN